MTIYQRAAKPRPDSEFEGGSLRHLTVGRPGRLLDPRRTPVSVIGVDEASGNFRVRIEDFEDRGAVWEVELENVGHYQFEPGGAGVDPAEIARYEDAIARFDRSQTIPCSLETRARTLSQLMEAREEAGRWLERASRFLASGDALPDPETRTGHPLLQDDLGAFMTARGLAEVEETFARRFVSNPYSGDLVNGHRVVIAEMGLVPFEGKVIRDPAVFDGSWSREERVRHVLARMAFVHEYLARAGHAELILYRGVAAEGTLHVPANRTFVSASFSRAVAESHFESLENEGTQALYRQRVPVERMFMTYLETEAMNEQFEEAEAVLLYDPENAAF